MTSTSISSAMPSGSGKPRRDARVVRAARISAGSPGVRSRRACAMAVGRAAARSAGISGRCGSGSSAQDSLQASSRMVGAALGKASAGREGAGRGSGTTVALVRAAIVMSAVLVVMRIGDGFMAGWGAQGQPALGLDQPSPPRGRGIGIPVAFGPAGKNEGFGEGQHVQVRVARLRPGNVGGRRNPTGGYGGAFLFLPRLFQPALSSRARERVL